MRSCDNPTSSASSAERSALADMASRYTSRASTGALDSGVRVHHLREKILIERAPIHSNPDGLVVIERDADDRSKVLVAALAADVARIDAILRERLGTGRVLGEQQMPVVMEIADDRDGEPVCRTRSTISGTAAAASSLFTVTRTSSEPGSLNAMT